VILDVARWVGAVKHDAEGSYMQLPEHLGVAFRRWCGFIEARLWLLWPRDLVSFLQIQF